MQDVRIELGLEPRVIVDGDDLTDKVDFVGVQCELGQTLPIVTLGMKAVVQVDGAAVVEAAHDLTPTQHIHSFLDGLDAEEIYDLAMESEKLETPGGVVAAIIDVMKGKANE